MVRSINLCLSWKAQPIKLLPDTVDEVVQFIQALLDTVDEELEGTSMSDVIHVLLNVNCTDVLQIETSKLILRS